MQKDKESEDKYNEKKVKNSEVTQESPYSVSFQKKYRRYTKQKEFKLKDSRQRSLELAFPKETLWKQSATSLVRNRSPEHKISQAPRFSSIEKDQIKNRQFLTLQLRRQIKKGTTFGREKRKDHFIKKNKSFYPSPATYNKIRFLDDSCKDKNSSSNKFQVMNPELNDKIRQIAQSFKGKIYNLSTLEDKMNNTSFTFSRFSNDCKKYYHHGRNIPYQSELFCQNPGVGQYTISQKNSKPAYTLRKPLKRFNQPKYPNQPAPGSYNLQVQSNKPLSLKGSFPKSQRTYLANPDNQTPGPAFYEVKRFFQ